jgi:dTMP kinase
LSVLIDIEGIDGAGKGTQAARLRDRLTAAGRSVALISFPRYQETLYGKAVGEYLNGAYGSLDAVHPFLVSLLFAGDRLESKGLLAEALARHDVVLLDRYVPSNVAHQASKREGSEREELIGRILQIEFEINGLPRPDLVLLLDLPVSVAQQLVARKAARSYTDRAADIQEADGAYLQRVRDVYLRLAETEPNWRRVSCCDGEKLRSVEEINDDLWRIIA